MRRTEPGVRGWRVPWDVVLFVAAVLAFIWLVIPTGLSENTLRLIAGSLLAIPIVALWSKGYTLQRLGFGFRDFGRSLPLYLGGALLFAGLVLLWNHDQLTFRDYLCKSLCW